MNAERTKHTERSFYENAWPMSFALVKDWLQRESSLRHIKKSKSKFAIFNGDFEESSGSLIPCETLSEAVTKMLLIVQSKPEFRIYHVSLWQLHGDLEGTFHRVGYSEDKGPSLWSEEFAKDNKFWHDVDRKMSDKVYKEMP